MEEQRKLGILYKVGGAIVGGGLLILAAPTVLSVFGFTTAGIAASSFAAGIQSIFYGAATTGTFSAAQSVGASGLGLLSKCALGLTGGVFGNYIGKSITKKEENRKLKKWYEF